MALMALSRDPFITACWTAFFLYWMFAAFWTKPTIGRAGWRSRWWVWLLITAWFIILTIVVGRRSVIRMSRNAILWQPTPTLNFVADWLTLAGLIVAVWARTILARNWSATVVLKEQHELIERGPYGYVRHPIYSGALLMLLGTVLLSGTVVGLMVLGIATAGLGTKAYLEERLLTMHFPQEYGRYRARVRAMLVPGVL